MPLLWHLHRTLTNGFGRNVAAGGAEPARPLSLAPPGPHLHHHHSSGSPTGSGPRHAGGSLCLLLYSLGAATKSPALRGHRAAGWLSLGATTAGGAETCHGEDSVTVDQRTRKKAAEQCKQGKVCPAGRAPGTVLPDVGQAPRGAPRRLLGLLSPACTAPSTAACPGTTHSVGASLLLQGLLGAMEWGPHHDERVGPRW